MRASHALPRPERRSSPDRYRHFFEALCEGILILDSDSGDVVEANPFIAQMLGYTADDLASLSIWNLLAPASAVVFRPVFTRLRREGGMHRSDLCFRRNDGGTIDVELISSRSCLGEAEVIQCSVRDIGERKRMEEALGERIKELHCISRVTAILHRQQVPLATLLDEVAHALAEAWRFPGLAMTRIVLDGGTHQSDAFEETPWAMSELIEVDGHAAGRIDICYRQEPPGPGEYFLDEEYALLAWLAGEIGRAREHRRQALRFRSAIEGAPDAMVIVDDQGCINLVNAQTERLFGYAREELIGQQIEILLPEALREGHRGRRRDYAAEPSARPMGSDLDLRARRRDGSEFPVEVSLSPLESSDGSLVVSAIRDISERRRAELALKRLHRMRVMMSEVSAMIVRATDAQELLLDACRTAVEGGGFLMAWVALVDEAGEVRTAAAFGAHDDYATTASVSLDPNEKRGQGPTGRALRDACSVVVNDIAQDPCMEPWREAALARGFRSSAAVPLLRDDGVVGSINFYAGDVEVFDAEEVRLLEELAGDVAFALTSIEQRQRIDFLALHDSLTGLANRTLFVERLRQMMQSAETEGGQMALLVLDMERFKSVNDALGMVAGDDVLRIVSERLVRLAGDHEHVARLEGDRFAMVIPHIHSASDLSALVEERMWATLGEPLIRSGIELRPTARTGIALYPDDGCDAQSLLGNAEAALKKAKNGNEHYVFYAPQMNRAVHQRLSLEGRLRSAVEAREFELHYQPKLNLRTGCICGAEALLRWPTADEGLNVTHIVRLLEDTGLIQQVGRWAIEQALRDRRSWIRQGLDAPPVAVNVSVMQFRQASFVDDVAAMLSVPEWGDGRGIELEITESTLMRDLASNQAQLQRLCALGIPIAIDDFGTGYSSLSYLSRLPLSALKVDRSFVVESSVNPSAMNIVSAIVSLAKSLHLRVIAEGVDTPEQVSMLRELGCDEMQGFLFSRAVSAEAFAGLVRDNCRLSHDGKIVRDSA
ncbi:EAL and GGDEF domain-containing protein [Algiphilus sp.]|uniref:sensor domain-containing protein n=1 Tax=Algiphilus sp. TaxID=1872431 RepID=UPI003B51EB47